MAWPQLAALAECHAVRLTESVKQSSNGHWWQSADQNSYVLWLHHLIVLRIVLASRQMLQ